MNKTTMGIEIHTLRTSDGMTTQSAHCQNAFNKWIIIQLP